MNEQLKQIAERLRGLRDSLDLTSADMAEKFHITQSEYETYESGNADIPMSFLFTVAQTLGVDLTSLISGDEAHLSSYSVVRSGQGQSVERVAAYKYQSLSGGFKNPHGEAFLVTVEPKPESEPLHLNTHPTQEFNMVIQGRLFLQIDGKDIALGQGDSIYFDATKPHGMKALDGRPVKFLAIIL